MAFLTVSRPILLIWLLVPVLVLGAAFLVSERIPATSLQEEPNTVATSSGDNERTPSPSPHPADALAPTIIHPNVRPIEKPDADDTVSPPTPKEELIAQDGAYRITYVDDPSNTYRGKALGVLDSNGNTLATSSQPLQGYLLLFLDPSEQYAHMIWGVYEFFSFSPLMRLRLPDGEIEELANSKGLNHYYALPNSSALSADGRKWIFPDISDASLSDCELGFGRTYHTIKQVDLKTGVITTLLSLDPQYNVGGIKWLPGEGGFTFNVTTAINRSDDCYGRITKEGSARSWWFEYRF